MSKPRPKKRLTAQQLKDDLAFYRRLTAMPPEKLALLSPSIEAIVAVYKDMLAAHEEAQRAEEALATIREETKAAHLALCDARIAAIRGAGPGDKFDDDEAVLPDVDKPGGGSTLH